MINDDYDNNTIILRSLSDRQKIVIETMVMRLSTKESLLYLQDHGFPITEATYKIGFVDQHLDKIDKLECIEKEMWKKYRECNDPYKDVEILTQIANLQPFISAYYDSTRYVLKKQYPSLEKKEYSEVF
jgi:hypothetical protein